MQVVKYDCRNIKVSRKKVKALKCIYVVGAMCSLTLASVSYISLCVNIPTNMRVYSSNIERSSGLLANVNYDDFTDDSNLMVSDVVNETNKQDRLNKKVLSDKFLTNHPKDYSGWRNSLIELYTTVYAVSDYETGQAIKGFVEPVLRNNDNSNTQALMDTCNTIINEYIK